MRPKISSWAFLFPILGPLTLFVPMLLRGEAIYWGTAGLQFIPWRAYAWEVLHTGDFPLWNPLNGMGAPLVANYQSALFYPPIWLTYLFWVIGGVPWMAWAHTLLVAVHLAWGGIGMVFLARYLEMSKLAQTVCGLCFSLCGYLVARASFFSMIYTASWLPWVVYFASFIASPYKRSLPLAETQKYKRIRLLLSISFMLLAGHAQLSLYILLLSVSWVLAGGIREGGLRGGMFSIWQFSKIILGTLMLTAVQLLPTAEYLLDSYRSSGVDYLTSVGYSFWPWRLITLIAPGFFGDPGNGDYWGYASYWEDAVYLGVFPLLLSLYSLISFFKKRNLAQETEGRQTLIAYLLAILALGLFFSLGKNNPGYYYFYRYVPTFNMFNAPSRWLIWVEFALILLAGLGLDRLRAPQGRGLYWIRLATAGGGAVTIGALLARILLPDVAPTFVKATATTGVFLVCSGCLLLFLPNIEHGVRRTFWSAIVVAVVFFDLIYINWNLNPSIPITFFGQRNLLAPFTNALSEGRRIYLSLKDEYSLKFNRFLRFDDYNPIEDRQNLRLAMIPNLNLLDGLSSVNNFDPLVTSRYRLFLEEMERLDENEKRAWLKAIGVGLIEKIDVYQPSGITFEELDGAELVSWINCAGYAHDEETALALFREMVKQTNQFVVIEKGDTTFSPECGEAKTVNIQIVDRRATSLLLEVSTENHGWLLVRDSWYPGWGANIDGQNVRVYRANYLFKAIRVGPGRHIVSFTYRPLSFFIGGLISLIGWLVWGSCILLGKLRK